MPAIPAQASDLSPAWLSEALGADVVDVKVLDQSFATNQRLRIGLKYRGEADGPARLFVKLAPLDPAHREMIGASYMGKREAQFYSDVAPSIGLRVPRSYFAATAPDGDFILLLEDLATSGSTFSDGSWGISSDDAAGALEDLALFHARFGDDAERTAVTPWLEAPRAQRGDMIPQLLRSVLDKHREVLTPAYIAAGEIYVDHYRRIDELWNTGPQTYIHGDPHIGNVFLDNGRVGFFDWGLSRLSTPLRDVSYFLTMAVDPEDRRRSERDLLRIYVRALGAAGGADITFDDAWSAHRLQAAYTVLATFLAFMPSYAAGDGQSLGSSLLKRSELALDDLEVVDAMKASLA